LEEVISEIEDRAQKKIVSERIVKNMLNLKNEIKNKYDKKEHEQIV